MQTSKRIIIGPAIIIFISLMTIKVWAQEKIKEVNLATFLEQETSSQDATPAVRKALEYCRKTGASRLVIPKGTYQFWPAQATEKYLFTSNNDEGLKRIIFLLENMEHFEIDGQGSRFIFHGFVSPFVMEGCRDIYLHNFSIDWARTFHSEGKILEVDNEGMELSFSPAYPYRVVNNRLVFYGENNTVFPYGGLLEFDPVKRETAYMAEDYWTNSDLPAKAISPGHVRIFMRGIKGTPGNIMTFGAGGRLCSAVTISDSRDIKIDHTTIFHCGGMGIVAQRSGNISIDHVQVTPSAGRMVSATADATHFANCSGNIAITNCLFENQLDDATNIHGIYAQVVKKLSSTKLLVALKHPQQAGFDFLKPGVTIEMVHSNSLISYGHATVQAAERINKEYTSVQFTMPLPPGMITGDVVATVEDTPFVNISNCMIRNNRARGILLGSRGRILIEKNLFHNGGAAILFEGDAKHWFEQAGVKNVTISGNTFDNCNYGVWGNAVIQVGSGIDPQSRKTSRYNSNIVIEGNTFRIFNPRLINAYGVDKLVFRDNIIQRTTAYKNLFPAAEAFEINNCDGVDIQPEVSVAGKIAQPQ